MGLISYSCSHILGHHEPIHVKFGVRGFFIMFYWNIIMKMLKCKKENLMMSHFSTLWKNIMDQMVNHTKGLKSRVYRWGDWWHSGIASGWHGWTMSRGPSRQREKAKRKIKKIKEMGRGGGPESPLSTGPEHPCYATAMTSMPNVVRTYHGISIVLCWWCAPMLFWNSCNISYSSKKAIGRCSGSCKQIKRPIPGLCWWTLMSPCLYIL